MFHIGLTSDTKVLAYSVHTLCKLMYITYLTHRTPKSCGVED
jgi:hypothetical protein